MRDYKQEIADLEHRVAALKEPLPGTDQTAKIDSGVTTFSEMQKLDKPKDCPNGTPRDALGYIYVAPRYPMVTK